MAKSAASDTRFLEQKNGKWRVTVAVPRELHAKLGTRLKRPLHTDSLALANRMKWPVVAELRGQIDETRGKTASDPFVKGAIETRRRLAKASDAKSQAEIEQEISDAVDIIAGREIGREEEFGFVQPIHHPEREQAAYAFRDIATGAATPLDLHHPAFLAQSVNKARTKADDERSLKFLHTWCERERVPATIEAINRKVAVRFMDQIGSIAGGQSPVTLQKYIGRLSRYWQWMESRELAGGNPWAKLKVPARPRNHEELERTFTDDEVRKLIYGPADQAMQDLMRIGALTGARLEVIVDLRVGDCIDGAFKFKPQKREAAPRLVPIHKDLAAIVARRTKGKPSEADLFPEWPPPQRAGSQRERSFKASNHFTAYRREVGVEVLVPGKRRSLVNFHSFRRWFITKAEQADQPESIIAAVVGHKRKGMTLGRYSAGPLAAQMRKCVEAVRLPAKRQAAQDNDPYV